MTEAEVDYRARLGQALQTISRLRSFLAERELTDQRRTSPIAVIGAACRLPGGADSPESFWRLLSECTDTVRRFPEERADATAVFDPDPEAPGKAYSIHGSFLDASHDVAAFDASLFGITPDEAVGMDPQHRLILELSWEALERAGLPPDGLAGSSTGVFLGASTSDYVRMRQQLSRPEDVNPYQVFGEPAFLAGRISYQYGLRGPAQVVDTACSSSLLAAHLACRSLREGECDLALAGGVNLMLMPYGFVLVSKAGAIAPDGRCKTFDASADGYGRGEGGVLLVLKRLADATADGDPVLAVIHGSAANHDGRSSGLTVPSGSAQQEVVRAALADAGLTPDDIGYVEAHGTGTALGDPIELRALDAALGPGRPADRPLLVGSAKANVGHLEAAAGATGLLKAALVLTHRQVPPQPWFRTPNPNLDWDRLRLRVPTAPTPLPAGEGGPYAGLSSFGASGTNLHMVLGAPPPRTPHEVPTRPHELLALSAGSEAALRALAARYADWLGAEQPPLAALGHAAALGRAHLPHRLAAVAASAGELRERLGRFAAGEPAPGLVHGRAAATRRAKVAFLFTGQGSQYPGMGRGLYASEPAFREAIDRCAGLLRAHLDRPLTEILGYAGGRDHQDVSRGRDGRDPAGGTQAPDAADGAQGGALLDRTAYTQPALFAVEYALAELWRSFGVEPGAVLGHSVGEYVAACVSGALDLPDALLLVATRARLMQALPEPGAMIAVPLPEEEALAEAAAVPGAAGRLSVASVNGARDTVLSGAAEAVDALAARLAERSVRARRLRVSHAFHSPLVEPALDGLREAAAQVTPRPPRIPLVSNLTGAPLTEAELADPGYWARHAREAVRFREGMATLDRLGFTVFLEAGPGRTLLGLGSGCLPEGGRQWIASMRRSTEDTEQIRNALGLLYTLGLRPHWPAVYPPGPYDPVGLPTYAFQRERYWFTERRPLALGEPGAEGAAADGAREAAGAGEEATRPALLERLRQAAPGDRGALVADHLRAQLAQALWTPAEEIGADTDLLGLGLDSLLCMQVVTACKRELAVTPALPRLFEDPTLDAWAAHITGLAEQEHALPGAAGGPERALADWTDPARLAREGELPEDIRPGAPTRADWRNPAHVLLTGATGFVGAHLLDELLRSTRATVHCLVRCENPAEGLARLRRNVERYVPWPKDAERRIEVLPGDLGKPLLGLGEAPFDALAHRLDAIYHNGALVNFVHTYRQLKAPNVGGTQEILRLACRGPLTPVNHVSTFAIWGVPEDLTTVFAEKDPLDRAGRLVNGYVQSKYVSEHVVLAARARGIPVNVYRLGQITGHSRTGACMSNSFTTAVIAGCVQLGRAPLLDMLVEMTPADYVCRALVHISTATREFGDAFHLVNPERIAFNDMIGHLVRSGWAVEQIPGEEFLALLQADIGVSEGNPLHLLVDTMREIVHAGQDSMSYRVDELRRALAGSGIDCPPLDERLLDTYTAWMVREGMLPAPAEPGTTQDQ
ncbi:type I polyketide synthase [Streptomyces hoynatensis]|uniref:Acyltransferase domain-containing protein n=1 Tax=Streptomyces hoynatensis TaxID=1141874 RepID=A0A3A9Z6H9_9ACTN|nr:type I polyketide synthase [Streptomyces hoynatensis]RKN43915.1 acyltransferase domain-containing protein [Streptomyces hoynatensis]